MDLISTATDILRRGGLVAFPTETVYGLGADATQRGALLRIFAVKGRRATNPLIVHVADAMTAKKFSATWPDTAEKLAAEFWPGPLTLVVPKSTAIANEATAGRDAVGLRVPNHPLALELLRAFDGPIAAPSANRSNHISPTTAEHVRQELGDAVDLILDGGPCTVGIESTVLDLSAGQPTILRPGGISREQIEAVIGPIKIFSGSVDSHVAAASPGQQERHYSPRTPAFRFERDRRDELIHSRRGQRPADAPHRTGKNPGLGRTHSTSSGQASEPRVEAFMFFGDASEIGAHDIAMPTDPHAYARILYDTLRQLDAHGYCAIYIEMPPDTPAWHAIRDRLMRATRLA
jgi:L-threonylcarbamoyladenylate synthase